MIPKNKNNHNNNHFINIIFYAPLKSHHFHCLQGEELIFRYFVSLSQEKCLSFVFEELVKKSALLKEKFVDPAVLLYKGEECIELDLKKPFSKLQLSKGNRQRDMVIVERQKIQKKIKQNKKPKIKYTPESIIDSIIPGEAIFYQLPASLVGHPKKVIEGKDTPLLDCDSIFDFELIGDLYISNYRISFVEQTVFTDEPLSKPKTVFIPFGLIKKIKKKKLSIPTLDKTKRIKFILYTLICKDYRRYIFAWDSKTMREGQIFQKIIEDQNVHNFGNKFCFSNLEHHSYDEGHHGWDLCNPQEELWRLGFVEEVDEGFVVVDSPKFSNLSLPRKLVIPRTLKNTKLLSYYIQLHQRGRFPLLVWGLGNRNVEKPFHGSLLFRCERLVTGKIDKDLLKVISATNERLFVYDTGYKMNFDMPSDLGTVMYEFLDLPMLSELASSLKSLYKHSFDDKPFSPDFMDNIEQTRWLDYIAKYLYATQQIIEILKIPRTSVIIENGGQNYENDSILSFLTQIAIDPFYRTIEGFCRLFDKEWVQFSFKYRSVLGNGEIESDKYPGFMIFVLFFNCIWELLQQNITAFEFTEEFLLFLLETVPTNRFGTFTEDSEELRTPAQTLTLSVWSYLMNSGVTKFRNEFFQPHKDTISIVITDFPRAAKASFWSAYFLGSNFILQSKQEQYSAYIYEHLCKPPSSLVEDSCSEEVLLQKKQELLLTDMDIFEVKSPYWTELQILQILVLKKNRLTSVPREFTQLTELRKIALEHSYVSHVSDVFRVLTHLTHISLQHNRICSLPESFGNLENLQILTLSFNKITHIRETFLNFEKLLKLDLSCNNLVSIPYTLSRLTNLESLSLSQNQLVTIQSSVIATLGRLTNLDVSENNLTMLPDTIGLLTRLSTLILRKNKFSELPDSIGYCTTMVELDGSNNEFMKIPKTIGNLRNLNFFYFQSNRITCIPPSIGRCSTLKKLYLGFNKIRELPLSIKNLKSVQEIILNNNQLTYLSIGIGECTSLIKLDLRKNNLIELPVTLGCLHGTLKELMIEENNHLLLPQENRGSTDTITEYLKGLQNGSERIHRIKLVVLGKENIGKTTLINRLSKRWSEEIVPLNNGILEISSQKGNKNQHTEPLEITSFVFYIDGEQRARSPRKSVVIPSSPLFSPQNRAKLSKKGTPVNVNIWDFSGQDLSHSYQEIFMTNRAIYLLVFSLIDISSETRIEYSLQSLKARIPNAAVFIVGTHADAESAGSNEQLNQKIEEMKAKYKKTFSTFSLQVLAVSGTTDVGIETLRKKIETVISKQKQIGERYPSNFITLENSLLQLKKRLNFPVITYSCLRTFASICGIKDQNSFEKAAKLLLDLGTLSFFESDPTGINLTILDPIWLSRTLNSLFTPKYNWTKQGVLRHGILSHIWKEFPQNICTALVALLQKFEILYELDKDAQDTLIWPSIASIPLENSIGSTPSGDIITEEQSESSSVYSSFMSSMSQSPNTERPTKKVKKINPEMESRSISASVINDDLILFEDNAEEFIIPLYDENGISFMPMLLPGERPSSTIIPILSGAIYRFDREYIFPLLPGSMYLKLMKWLTTIAKPVVLWRRGFMIKQNDTFCLVEFKDEGGTEWSIVVVSDRLHHAQQFYLSLTNFMDDQKSEWDDLPCKVIVSISNTSTGLLTNSLSESSLASSSYHNFPPALKIELELLENNMMKGDTSINIEQKTLEIVDISPDVGLCFYKGPWIDFDSIEFISKIADGGYGTVFKAKWSDKLVALKKLDLNNVKKTISKIFKEFRREVEIQSMLIHPNVINLVGLCLKPFCIITELADMGCLYDYLHDYDNYIPWKTVLNLSTGIASGMNYLHAQSVAHLDLKTPNILLCSNSSQEEPGMIAKIADFGTTRKLIGFQLSSRFVDNPVWLAPEILAKKKFGMKVDNYAFGIILWELVSRKIFFGEVQFMCDLEDLVLSGQRPPIDACPVEMEKLITNCWDYYPDRRPNFDVILKELQEIGPISEELENIRTKTWEVLKLEPKEQEEKLISDLEEEVKSLGESIKIEQEEKFTPGLSVSTKITLEDMDTPPSLDLKRDETITVASEKVSRRDKKSRSSVRKSLSLHRKPSMSITESPWETMKKKIKSPTWMRSPELTKSHRKSVSPREDLLNSPESPTAISFRRSDLKVDEPKSPKISPSRRRKGSSPEERTISSARKEKRKSAHHDIRSHRRSGKFQKSKCQSAGGIPNLDKQEETPPKLSKKASRKKQKINLEDVGLGIGDSARSPTIHRSTLGDSDFNNVIISLEPVDPLSLHLNKEREKEKEKEQTHAKRINKLSSAKSEKLINRRITESDKTGVQRRSARDKKT